ncbi:hypothetical protein MACJ_003379 [Theileria orientalis]|uniref:Uncharacterized protein n=1 Tax=Theileria orientalis TaxID=68886 RepID=A0A976XK81_THEOR|nr:hypothetical protein MACJ_003379 [Theileria orientalis]
MIPFCDIYTEEFAHYYTTNFHIVTFLIQLHISPTFVVEEGFDDEMSPHIITEFTHLRLSRDSQPEDKLDRLRREFVTILDSIDLKSTYKSIHKPRKTTNDVFIKTIY